MRVAALISALTVLLGCTSAPRITRVQTNLAADPAQVTVYVVNGEGDGSLHLDAAGGVEVVEAKIDGDALRVRWKRSGTCPMNVLDVPLDQLSVRYRLDVDSCSVAAD